MKAMHPRLIAIALLSPLLLVGGVSPATAAGAVTVAINMDSGPPAVASSVPVNVAVVRANSGGVSFVPSRAGNGRAASFPAYGSGRSAAIALTNAGTIDELSPGLRSFSFGADFRTGNGKADGDNVVQRGLADDAGQYKLEVDGGVASCTIKGRSGAATLRAGAAVVPGVWYSARCSKQGTSVALTVTRLDTGARWDASRSVTVGSVATKKATTPLTIGAKVTPAMQIANWSPDQFNGLIDNAFVQIDG